jgi:hypothetical protein
MTHHLGEPGPERAESLFEKPTPTRREPPAEEPGRGAPTDDAADAGNGPAEETAADETAADETPGAAGDEGPDAGSAPAAPGAGSRVADPGRGVSRDEGPEAGSAPAAPGAGSRVADPGRGVSRDEDRDAAGRSADDAFATSPMPAARPGGDPAAGERPTTSRPTETGRSAATWAAAVSPVAEPPSARSGGPPIGTPTDDPLADDERTTQFFGGPVPEHTIVDDAPTEALPVIAPAAGANAADDTAVAEWRPPRQTSRLTTILIIALLVALGFLAGVFVGRSAAPNPGSDGARPPATATARPGALR